ncbi:MAG: efflux RND transporter periplasmic adaptor subunit [Comamonadaceae bacterium]|nr:efflux RND transporter periplasmic adaptor subunit [Comamonadaceae bacterium]
MTVKRGRILAYLAPRLGGETDYAALEAGAAKARVARAQAQRERQRMETLFDAEAVPEKRVQAALAEEQMAAAELAATTRRLGQYSGEGRVAGGGIAIRAPLDGVVADVKAAAGGYVQEGALLFHIADTRRLWLEVRIPESEAVRLGQASGVWFALDGEDAVREFEAGKNAKLIAVGDVIDPATRTVAVVFEFANADRHLRLGQSVTRAGARRGSRPRRVAGAGVRLAGRKRHRDGVSCKGAASLSNGASSAPASATAPGSRFCDGLAKGERVVTKGAYLVRAGIDQDRGFRPWPCPLNTDYGRPRGSPPPARSTARGGWPGWRHAAACMRKSDRERRRHDRPHHPLVAAHAAVRRRRRRAAAACGAAGRRCARRWTSSPTSPRLR